MVLCHGIRIVHITIRNIMGDGTIVYANYWIYILGHIGGYQISIDQDISDEMIGGWVDGKQTLVASLQDGQVIYLGRELGPKATVTLLN